MTLINYNRPRNSRVIDTPLSGFDPWYTLDPWYSRMRTTRSTTPVWNTEEGVAKLEINVAGFPREELRVSVKKNKFVVVEINKADRNSSSSYYLPQDCMTETLTAKLENGILTIEVSLENSEKEIDIL